MSSLAFRTAARVQVSLYRNNALQQTYRSRPAVSQSLSSTRPFSFSVARSSGGEHSEESFEEFTARYEKEFEMVQDVFELQV
jgi:hypothetical protein